MISWPSVLVEDLSRRRCVIFLGAGVSKNSRNDAGRAPRNWHEFLSGAAERLGNVSDKKLSKRLLRERDYLTACEVIKDSMGDEEFISHVESEYLTPGYKSAEIHELIFKLDARIVLTPNFDKIYETYAGNVSEGTVKVKHYYADDVASVIRGRKTDRIIIKMHGTIDEPNKLIFSRKDYVSARSHNRDFYSLLDSLIMTHTFLFVGCGLDDPDIKLLLEDYAHKFRFSRSHYFIARKRAVDSQVARIVEATMKLKILEYSGSGIDHSKLVDSLRDLVVQTEAGRIDLAENQDW